MAWPPQLGRVLRMLNNVSSWQKAIKGASIAWLQQNEVASSVHVMAAMLLWLHFSC